MVIVDEGDWPLVLLNWETPIGAMDQALFLERFASWLVRRRAFALLSVQPDPDGRRIFPADWMRRHATAVAASCVAVACVVPDEVRCIDTAVRAEAWHAAMPCPSRTFSDTDEALPWLRRRLATARDPRLAVAATHTQRYIDMRGRGPRTQ